MVPAALPSMRISRGRTTVASATSGLVTAIRVTSKSVDTMVERPAVTETCGNCFGCGCCAPSPATVSSINIERDNTLRVT